MGYFLHDTRGLYKWKTRSLSDFETKKQKPDENSTVKWWSGAPSSHWIAWWPKNFFSSEFCLIYISTVLDGREWQSAMLARSLYSYVMYQMRLKRAFRKKTQFIKQSMVLYLEKIWIVTSPTRKTLKLALSCKSNIRNREGRYILILIMLRNPKES